MITTATAVQMDSSGYDVVGACMVNLDLLIGDYVLRMLRSRGAPGGSWGRRSLGGQGGLRGPGVSQRQPLGVSREVPGYPSGFWGKGGGAPWMS